MGLEQFTGTLQYLNTSHHSGVNVPFLNITIGQVLTELLVDELGKGFLMNMRAYDSV